jgi:hypothetical protein
MIQMTEDKGNSESISYGGTDTPKSNSLAFQVGGFTMGC